MAQRVVGSSHTQEVSFGQISMARRAPGEPNTSENEVPAVGYA